MANWKKITTDTDLTAISSSLTTTDQAISASVAALSGSASTARGLLGGGGGTTINTTDNVIPVRSDATTFVDSSITVTSGDQVVGGTQFALDNVQFFDFDPGLNPGDTCNFTFQNNQTLGTVGDPAIWQVTTELNSGDGTVIPVGVYIGTLINVPNGSTGLGATFSNDSGWTRGGSNIAAPASSAGILGVGSAISTLNQTTISSDLTVSGSAEITGSLGVTGSVSYSTNIIPIPGAWSSTNALNSEYQNGVAGAGTQTAGLAFNGDAFTAVNRQTEEYNGSSWSIGGAPLSNSNYSNFDGSGTQNDAMLLGSNYGTGQSQNYNGSVWMVGGTMSNNMGFSGQAGASVNTSLAFGGYDSIGTNDITCTEEYNGTSWSAGGALITGRQSLAGTGTQTAALAVGGGTISGVGSCTEEYDGTSWTVSGALSTARFQLGGAGTQTAGLAFGGSDGSYSSCTEEYDGTSWTVGGALSTARNCLAGAGTQTSGLAAGGGLSGRSTEEYTSVIGGFTKTFDYSESTGNITISNDATLTLTGSAKFQSTTSAMGDVWYQSGGLINPRGGLGGAGSANASLAIGGYDSNLGAILSCVEEYNGATWSVGSSLNIGLKNMGSAGAQNSALSFGGYDGGYSTTSVAQEYNGSTWSSISSMQTPRNSLSGAGLTAEKVITFGGLNTCNNTEEWAGGSWSTCAIMSNGRKWMGGTGHYQNAMAFGGSNGSSALSCTEKYNFNTWSTCSPMPIAKYGVGAAGGSTAGNFGSVDSLVFGGRGTSGGGCTSTECFVSNVWSATQNMNSENYVGGYSGIESAALSFGGYDGSSQGTTSNTERFNTSTPGGVGVDALSFDPTTGNTMIIPPTTDPLVVGALWNSNGTLVISLG